MKYKSLFVSDIHLGTKQCQIQYLLKFIHDNEFENIFLLGDIIDIWSLKNKWYWHKDHNTFIQKMLKYSRKQKKLIYILGNHDEAIREFIKDGEQFSFGDIEVVDQYEYKSIKGYNFLLIHGDQFDGAIRSYGMLYWIGDRSYEICLEINAIYNWFRKWFGMPYWSLSAYLKSKVKAAVQFVSQFDDIVLRTCLVKSYDGIIYGHSHTPEIKKLKNKYLLNTGDQVENMTCIVETESGNFQLLKLTDNTILKEF
jgi:UDP-2,3-diacylglucosamine pyrophosphatase LpxH